MKIASRVALISATVILLTGILIMTNAPIHSSFYFQYGYELYVVLIAALFFFTISILLVAFIAVQNVFRRQKESE
ncbi:hypothetical protein [Hymenobacter crusticola]|uniref:Uncharacterized protein n=1 Tax=Hymenobacter crusticola TaxID=1770526 RepID=A0A243W8I0_9BACT|nr:hypothetical protein [Hymenobacter crusticola]OUJ69783.1 hypothetical protein BXP70_26085 [Hymenobacter crusticola]